MSAVDTPTRAKPLAGIGANAARPDGALKVQGRFTFTNDIRVPGMLFGATLRSPHPAARIRQIQIEDALAMRGVACVLTQSDVPGNKTYGIQIPDKPVLAWDEVRYEGEAVALVAAEDPEIARRALEAIKVGYEPIEPVTDPIAAMEPGARQIHPNGNILRHIPVRRGDLQQARRQADVVVAGTYQIGVQDQAFLGTEAGLALPREDGGVEMICATQWLHDDRRQMALCLGLEEQRVRLVMGGIGGAFGAREDLSLQLHACLLALRTRRPVKMEYSRRESFLGHVHRHPARMRYEHGATRDGHILFVVAEIVLDGGAYASTSGSVAFNAACFATGPYRVPNVEVNGYAVYTNNPPAGAMRGFGSVQAAFGHESQMDKLAAQLQMDPVQLRILNALSTGDTLSTGQVLREPAPVADLLMRLRDMPIPAAAAVDPAQVEPRLLPGGSGNTTHGEGIRRGIGYGVGIKNVCFPNGFDDFSEAIVRLFVSEGEVAAEVRSAAAEVGQGVVTIQQQIVRSELGIEKVIISEASTDQGDSGPSSASRMSVMIAGALQRACAEVRTRVLKLAASALATNMSALRIEGGDVVDERGVAVISLARLVADNEISGTGRYHHRRTETLDPDTGQGDTHVALAFAAHRAVVDVDTELGLIRVVEMACAQDVGKAINPIAVEGQIQGGTAQGLGLALMEEVQVQDGRRLNPSFTDYLIPTIADMPPLRMEILELPRHDFPYGLHGVGEPPTISATPAIVNAIRAATGLDISRIPVRPEQIASPTKHARPEDAIC